MGKTKINFGLCKRILIGDSDFQANYQTVEKFVELIIKSAKDNATQIRENVKNNNRKTIKPEDID